MTIRLTLKEYEALRLKGKPKLKPKKRRLKSKSRKKAKKERSELELEFLGLIRLSPDIPNPQPDEERVCEGRMWRHDFYWPDHNVVFEVEGGVYTGGRHVQPVGFTEDCEKYNESTLRGRKVYRVTSKHIRNGKALTWVRQALGLEAIPR